MVKIGIIGFGGAGRAHARRFRRNKNVGEIYCYDIKKPDRQIEDERFVDSLDALFASVDAVSICTPDHLHYSDIVRSLEAGKHVLAEKPMVASSAEAARLREQLLRFPQLVFGVHHQMREAAPFRKAAELARAGALGKIFYVEANYWHDMRDRSSKFDNWRMETGQSLIFGHACHPLDLLMHVIGGEPESHATYLSKNAFGEYLAEYTSATTLMKFADGVVAKCHVNSCCAFPQFNNLIVMGDRGTYIDGILYDGRRFRQVSDFFSDGQSEASVNVVDVKLPRRLVSIVFGTYLRTFNWIANRLMSHPDFGFRQFPLTVYNHDGACQAIIDNFVQAVLGKEKILIGLDDAERVIRLCESTEVDGLARNRAAEAQAE